MPFEMLDQHRQGVQALCDNLRKSTEVTLHLAKADASFTQPTLPGSKLHSRDGKIRIPYR